jgi:hypothetical protein
MLVVRVENNSSGYGIWKHSRFLMFTEGLEEINSRHSEFPIPSMDGLNLSKNKFEWFCAYKSIEQFQEWIKSDEIKIIIGLGFDVLLIEVEDYQVGDYQVIFTKESIISTKIINELFL